MSTFIQTKGQLLPSAILDLIEGRLSWADSQWAVTLLSKEYVPDIENDRFLYDVYVHEVQVVRFFPPVTESAVRHLIGDRTVALTNNLIMGVTAGDPVEWVESYFDKYMQYMALYQDTGNPKTSRLFLIWRLNYATDYVSQMTLPNPIWQIAIPTVLEEALTKEVIQRIDMEPCAL